jgi:phenylacetate-coenzyme A ligase PaaK-like adenylate-forming protein
MTVVAPTDQTEAIRTRVGELLERDRWPRQRLLAHQHERLRALLRHAVEHSPYYREALGADAPEHPLASLPTLSKELLMEELDSVVTDPRLHRADLEACLERADAGERYRDEYYVFSTSGTTGAPAIVVYSHAELVEWAMVAFAALARVGVTGETRFVAIGAPSALHLTRRQFAVMQSSGPRVPRLTVATPLDEMVASLDAYRPEALLSYASVVAELADAQLEGRLEIAPRVVITTSEVSPRTPRRLSSGPGA